MVQEDEVLEVNLLGTTIISRAQKPTTIYRNNMTPSLTNIPRSALGVPGFALVTGAGSGIGRAICLLLAREGSADILLADFKEDSAMVVRKEVIDAATNLEFKAVIARTDVRNGDSAKSMVSLTVKTFGRLDYAVNCIGIGFKAISDTQLPDWDTVVSTNLTGVFLCIREEIQQMEKQRPRDNGQIQPPLLFHI